MSSTQQTNNVLGLLIDSSGSMMDMNPKETTQSLNKNVQKIEAENTKIFAARFSDEYEMFIKNKTKSEVVIKEEDITPQGLTALYDSIYQICSDIRETINPDLENNITIIILTDGYENASQKYNVNHIKKLISGKKEEGWKFIFLGANQDAITTGQTLGLDHKTCCTYSPHAGGLDNVLRSTSQAINRSAHLDEEIEFTQEERNESMISN